MIETQWIDEWFGSPYYHILYKNRDQAEAREMVDGLFTHLKPKKGSKIVDLACGVGRHSIYMNSLGYDVLGLDIAAQNISYASQFSSDSLHFSEHDMRDPFGEEDFDVVFNLFTSFGYFDTEEEHQETITNVANALKPGGAFVLDYLNTYSVINNLVPEQELEIDGINFSVKKYIDRAFIIKEIGLTDNGVRHKFKERVRAIQEEDFVKYFENAGLTIEGVYGDYEMNPYRRQSSGRMIFILKK